MSFSPAEIATEIQKAVPDFTIDYKPDYRQAIANGWPQSIDDSVARHDWLAGKIWSGGNDCRYAAQPKSECGVSTQCINLRG